MGLVQREAGPILLQKHYMYLTWNWNPPLKNVFFERAKRIFESALQQVAGNKELQQRVEVLEMPVYFAALLYLPGDHSFFQKAKREFFPFVDKITREYPLNKRRWILSSTRTSENCQRKDRHALTMCRLTRADRLRLGVIP